jgi:membrane protein YdbS with pleckstrin-like domain
MATPAIRIAISRTSKNFLAALDIMSFQDYFTQTLKKDETVISIVRKHWITLALPVTIAVLIIGVLIGFVDVFFGSLVGIIVWLVVLGVTLVVALYYWVIHHFDSFIITDMRIVDIDQKGLFKRTVSETTFDKVQDVTYSVVGVVATSLNYGTVHVQTGGAVAKIELDHVPHPRSVQETILEAQSLFKKRHGGELTAQQLVEILARLKNKQSDSGAAEPETEEDQAGDVEE